MTEPSGGAARMRFRARGRKRREVGGGGLPIALELVVEVAPAAAFGVPTSVEVAEFFADDAQRFAAMGYGRRRRT